MRSSPDVPTMVGALPPHGPGPGEPVGVALGEPVGDADGLPVGVGEGDGEAVGEAVGEPVGAGLPEAVGDGAAEAVAVAVAVAVGEGVGDSWLEAPWVRRAMTRARLTAAATNKAVLDLKMSPLSSVRRGGRVEILRSE
jgi:hypothetical protein